MRDSHPAAGEPPDLLSTFSRAIIGGRWLLVVAETLVSVIMLIWEALEPRALLALALLFVYNSFSLVLVHRLPIRRVPVFALLCLDLFFVATVAYHTEGAQSPFLGQCYLIIFAGALFYGLPGGVAVGIASTSIAVFLAGGFRSGLEDDLRDLIPYFLLAGTFTGYLVDAAKSWFYRYQEGQARAREQELQVELARREMALARSMQKAALPVVPPRVPGLEIAARSLLAQEVGGDFHLFLRSGDRTGLAVGDVAGKGIPAALVSTSIGHLLPWLQPLWDAHAALDSLNQHLSDRLPDGSFVTLALMEVDGADGSARFWSAGHPPSLVWEAGAGQIVESRARGPLLGFLPEWDGEPEERTLAPGDVVVLYTDGLVETRNERREMFGPEGVAAVLARSAERSAEEIAGALIEAVESWGSLTDDLTLLVCKRVAAGPEPGPGPDGGAPPDGSAR